MVTRAKTSAHENRLWMLLVYSVPRHPSASRVYVWRRLKRLGAVMLQDATWVLPASAETREQLQWLAAEIKELDGSASLWESRLTLDGPERELVMRFAAPVEKAYREILTALKRKNPDLPALSRRYQQLQTQVFFRSTLGRDVRAALVAVRGGSS